MIRFKPTLPTFVFLLLFWVACPSYWAMAQDRMPPPAKDIAEIRQLYPSTEKTMYLLRYVRNPKTIYTEELKNLLEEALQHSKNSAREDLVASVLATQAITELGLGNRAQALTLIQQAESYLPKLPEQLIMSVLNDLSRVYSRIEDPEKSIYYYNKIEAFTKDKPQYIIPRVFNLRNRSNFEIRRGNPAKAKEYLQMALSLAKQSDNASLYKDTRFAYANLLVNLDKEKEAFELLKELVPDLENNINDRTVQFFGILARNYESLGDYKNAFLYTEKAFNLPNVSTQQLANNINKMILLAYRLQDFSRFDDFFALHRKYGMDQNSLHSKKMYEMAEAYYYEAKNQPKKAKASFIKAYRLKIGTQQVPGLDLEILSGLANLYASENKRDSSDYYFKLAGAILKKHDMPPALKLLYSNSLKTAHQANGGNPDTLIKSLEQQIQLKDTLYQMAMQQASKELETKYKVNEKEQQLALAQKQQEVQKLELQQQKQRNWIIFIGSAVVVLLLSGLAYILFQRKKQAGILHRATLNNLKQQHQLDLMNTLTEVQEQEKKRIATQLHDEVGAMLSIAKLNINTLNEEVFAAGSGANKKLEVAQNLLGNISETVRNISHALMPIALEKYGFKAAIQDLISAIKTANRLTVEHIIEGFEHTEKWPPQFTLSTYRIIQEILNNAIKHAEAKHLFIQLIELENSLTIYVEDDGKGIAQERDTTAGAGMKLLQTNIAYLSGKLEIEGKPNEGTFVLIELPIPPIKLP